jgi:hypothetical protein
VRTGDLRDLETNDLFRNVIFADEADIDHAALRVSRAAEEFREVAQTTESAAPFDSPSTAVDPVAAILEEQHVPSPRHIPVEARRWFADSVRRFAEQIDAAEPSQIYESILAQSAELLHAERSSLWLLDETASELIIKAARGIPTRASEIERVRVGEGITGSVMRLGQPLLSTIDALGRESLPERKYKTSSFISYPITIGPRKIGVLNLADKRGGALYNEDDPCPDRFGGAADCARVGARDLAASRQPISVNVDY